MSRPAYPFQRGLWAWNGVLFVPAGGTDGTGRGLGPPWNVVAGPVVSHPTPTGTTLVSQLRRTAYTQVVTTANQEMGPRLSSAADAQFSFGTTAGRGGVYFSSIFSIEAWFNNTGRLFVGLAASAAGSIVTAVDLAAVSALATSVLGLYHDGTDGPNVLSILSAAGGAATKTAVAGATLAAGSGFQFELWCYAGTSTWNYRLTSLGAATESALAWNTIGGPSAFLAPQCQMSNGASDVTAGHFAIGVANICVEPAPAQ